MRGACTDSMIKPDVPLQGFEPPSSSSHVHIRYNLPVALRPPWLQTIARSWAAHWSKKVAFEGHRSLVYTLIVRNSRNMLGIISEYASEVIIRQL